MTTLGDQIKQLRFKKGITQEALADSVGVTKASISNYECNHRKPPYHILCAIAKTLETDVDRLLSYMMPDKSDSDTDSIIDKNSKPESKRPRRVKKLLSAFYKLTDEAQLKAIERLEELTMIPAYQLNISDVLQQYVSNRCRLTYELVEDTKKTDVYDGSFDQSWEWHTRHMVFQHGENQDGIYRWDFFYLEFDEAEENSEENHVSYDFRNDILSNLDIYGEHIRNVAFVFDNEYAFDEFYEQYQESQDPPDIREFESHQGIPALFLLLDKETLEIKDVADYDPNVY